MNSVNPGLHGLYPFLHGVRQDAGGMRRTLLDSVAQKAQDSVQVKSGFFAANAGGVVDVAQAIAGVYLAGGRLFCMGNGGSSCDAAHIAVEFMHPVTAGRPALAAVNLTADIASMSAVANDVGYSHVFVRQILALARPGDALIGVSTSGNSDNLLAAFAAGRRLGLVTIGLSGGNGGLMARNPDLDHCLIVGSDSIHRVQETHVAIYHILWDLVHTLLADLRGGLEPDAPP